MDCGYASSSLESVKKHSRYANTKCPKARGSRKIYATADNNIKSLKGVSIAWTCTGSAGLNEKVIRKVGVGESVDDCVFQKSCLNRCSKCCKRVNEMKKTVSKLKRKHERVIEDLTTKHKRKHERAIEDLTTKHKRELEKLLEKIDILEETYVLKKKKRKSEHVSTRVFVGADMVEEFG